MLIQLALLFFFQLSLFDLLVQVLGDVVVVAICVDVLLVIVNLQIFIPHPIFEVKWNVLDT